MTQLLDSTSSSNILWDIKRSCDSNSSKEGIETRFVNTFWYWISDLF
jgi:hypothetical protein